MTNAPTDPQQNKEQSKMTDELSENVPVKGELKNGVATMDPKDACRPDPLFDSHHAARELLQDRINEITRNTSKFE
jgi:hypothetical protein